MKQFYILLFVCMGGSTLPMQPEDQKKELLSYRCNINPFSMVVRLTQNASSLIHQLRLNSKFAHAINTGNREDVHDLITQGADLESIPSSTPLIAATNHNHTEICEILVNAGAQIDGSYGGETPLMYAVLKGNNHLCKLYIDAGANVNNIDGDNNTIFKTMLLHCPEETKQLICNLLLDGGLIITAQEIAMIGNPESPLHQQILTHALFAPSAQEITDSQKKIHTTLCCLKRVCPQLPKGPDKMILAYLEDAGNVMIGKKIRGDSIQTLAVFDQITNQVLYKTTLKQLAILTHQEESEIETIYGIEIQNTLKNRCAQPRLVINGTAEKSAITNFLSTITGIINRYI